MTRHPSPESARLRCNLSSSSPITSSTDALKTPTFAPQTPAKRVYPQKPTLGASALRDGPPGGIMCISYALVAQPDRASDYESEGRRFESCRARCEIVACPSISETIFGLTFFESNNVAHVCRSEWKVKPESSALSRSGLKPR